MTTYNRTPAQTAAIRELSLQGFAIDQEEPSCVRMVRGNDYRLVLMNGQQKRAMGAQGNHSSRSKA